MKITKISGVESGQTQTTSTESCGCDYPTPIGINKIPKKLYPKKKKQINNVKEAARTKSVVDINEILPANDDNRIDIKVDSWDDIFTLTKKNYSELKNNMASNPSSPFWNDQFVKDEITKKLTEMGYDKSTINVAIINVLHADKSRKTKKASSNSILKSANDKSQFPFREPVDSREELSNQFEFEISEAEKDLKDEPELGKIETLKYNQPQQKSENSYYEDQFENEITDYVEVIYPDYPNEGKFTSFKIPVPLTITKKGVDDVLDYTWRQTNHVNGLEWISGKPYRSSMVGDVFVIDNVNYVVLGIGFAKLPISLKQWLNVPNKFLFFKISDFEKLIKEAFSRKLKRKVYSQTHTSNNTNNDECQDCKLK